MSSAQDGSHQLLEVESAIRGAWGPDTSNSDWAPDNPAHGQCAVTALVVQDYLGGQILRAKVHGQSHYWNRLLEGMEVDLTREQFDVFEFEKATLVSRRYILSYPMTRRRYERLLARVSANLCRRGRADFETKPK